MSATLELPDAYLAAAPIIVTSPTPRCGTTLVQRLLSASDNAFIYGEEIGTQFRTLATLFAHQLRVNEQNGDAVDETFYRALAGGLHDWRPGLTPPADVVRRAWANIFYQLPLTLAGFNAAVQRPLWGFKWPGCEADLLRTYLTLMPKAKVVYVVRNIADTLRSAKARRFVKTTAEAEAFATSWAANLGAMDGLKDDPRVLMVCYETLIADREAQTARIEAFTGAAGIQRSEFDLKVNTFAGAEADGNSPTQYIAPAPLSTEDEAAIARAAGAMMLRYYPSLASA